MATAQTIVNLCNDVADIMDAIKKRAVLAEAEAKGANRQANKLGTNITGGRGGESDVQYGDPTKDDALNALATLERVQASLGDVRQAGYWVAAELAEWAPNRAENNGIRRCGEDDCAQEHHALGLCQAHYRALKRKESRVAAIKAAEQRAS